MALITSKPIITISKEEMKKHVENMYKKLDTGLEKLSPEKRKFREDVLLKVGYDLENYFPQIKPVIPNF